MRNNFEQAATNLDIGKCTQPSGSMIDLIRQHAQEESQSKSPVLLDSPPGDMPERPFPLERRYRRQVLPIIALFVLSLIALTALAVRQTIREVHLEFAARRVAEIITEMNRKTPSNWATLLASSTATQQRQRISAMLLETAVERGLPRLKIYDQTGQVLFSTDLNEVGGMEKNAALATAIEEHEAVLLAHQEANGTR